MQDICPSTAKNAHIYVRVLHDACKRLGGEHKLAEYLGVDVGLITAWLSGDGFPSDDVFLRCLDILENKPGSDPDFVPLRHPREGGDPS